MDRFSVERFVQLNDAFTEKFSHLQTLYNNDELVECEKLARDLLLDPELPGYHRMRTLILLCSTADDPNEAEDFRLEAETKYCIIRGAHRVGAKANVDEALAEVRSILDEAEEILERELNAVKQKTPGAPRYDPKRALQQRIAAREKDIAEYNARADDPEELKRIDLAILGMSEEESLAKLAQKAARNNNDKQVKDQVPAEPSEARGEGAAPPFEVAIHKKELSAAAQRSIEESRKAGFGGGKPFKSPMVKKSEGNDN